MSIDCEAAQRQFESHFGHAPTAGARAPGRVNIIGEHTDYNDGFVLPMAIERETVILARPRNDGILNAYAANLGRSAQTGLGRLVRNGDEPWMDYVTGVARELEALGRPAQGADLFIVGDVPVGAGLSSSASLEMATLRLFEALGDFRVGGPEGARLGQRVENEFLGLKTGIMDQFIVRMGEEGRALFLDCRTYEYETIPIEFDDAVFVIANTGVSRGLSASKYNERVQECQEALRVLQDRFGKGIQALRDCPDVAGLDACRESMGDIAFRRARHVVTENSRTRRACEAMRRGDVKELGALMNESDLSLQADYEVTCTELEVMTGIARSFPSCFGSRMTGAGFGGCTVSLTARSQSAEFCEYLTGRYHEQTGLTPEMVVSKAAAGATQILKPRHREAPGGTGIGVGCVL